MSQFNSQEFLKVLHEEVNTHSGVNHVFLARCATNPFTREDYRIFGLQHYPLVGLFTTYMERLLLRGPDSQSKSWLAKVLVDEYGEGSDGEDHAQLYRHYLTSCGVPKGEEDTVVLDERVVDFVQTHLHLVNEEPFLVGLGALGPGHEWAIPKMFAQIIEGLERAGFSDKEISYFKLHVVQDEDHAAWLEEALIELIQTKEQADQVRRGAMLSLQARHRFWDGVQNRVVNYRQPMARAPLKEHMRLRMGRPQSKLSTVAQKIKIAQPVYRPQVRALAGLS